jgi:hypothetical protein
MGARRRIVVWHSRSEVDGLAEVGQRGQPEMRQRHRRRHDGPVEARPELWRDPAA